MTKTEAAQHLAQTIADYLDDGHTLSCLVGVERSGHLDREQMRKLANALGVMDFPVQADRLRRKVDERDE